MSAYLYRRREVAPPDPTAKSRRHGDLTRHSDFTRRGDRQQRVQSTGERTSHTEKSQHPKMYAEMVAERLKNLKVNKYEFLRRIAKYTRCHMNTGSLTITLGASQSQKQLFEWPGIEKPTAKKQTLSQNSPQKSKNNGFSSSDTFKIKRPKKKPLPRF